MLRKLLWLGPVAVFVFLAFLNGRQHSEREQEDGALSNAAARAGHEIAPRSKTRRKGRRSDPSEGLDRKVSTARFAREQAGRQAKPFYQETLFGTKQWMILAIELEQGGWTEEAQAARELSRRLRAVRRPDTDAVAKAAVLEKEQALIAQLNTLNLDAGLASRLRRLADPQRAAGAPLEPSTTESR
jgi:hypothetical protein